jgi:thioredoxin reductase
MSDQTAGQHADESYDVVVVGGGSAGLSGALALGRARRRVLVIDADDPRNAPAAGVHNYLTSEGMPPEELRATGRAEVARYGVSVVPGWVTARRLLVTTGLTDELPEIPGLAERWGRDVLHCPYCHGWEVQDQALGILATSPMSVHSALLFRQWSDDVVFFTHTAEAPTPEQAEQLAARGIAVVDGAVAGLEIEDDRIVGVRLASGRVVPRQAVAVGPRFLARAEVLADLALPTAELTVAGHVVGTFVPADPTGATEVAGVWVAGNVADPMAQVIVAAAAGLKAGAAINADLVAEDTARAVVAHRASAGLVA